MKFHRRIIATGNEWQPCIECGHKFEAGELLSAVDTEGNAGVLYWYCEECTSFLFGHLLRKGWRGTWKILKGDGSRKPVDWNGAA